MAILKKYIGNNQVGAAKILLEQNSAFRATSTSGSDESLFKLDTENVFRLLKLPRASFDPAHSDDLVRKSYLESSIVDASALLRLEISAVDLKVDQEIFRAQAEEARLQQEIDSEEQRALSAESALGIRIDTEYARAVAREDEIEAIAQSKIPLSYIGSQVAPLIDGKLPNQYLSNLAITEVFVRTTIAERDALVAAGTVQTGDVVKVTEAVTSSSGAKLARSYIFDGSAFVELSTESDVDSVQGQVGHILLTSLDIPEAGDNRYYTAVREQAAKDYADMAVATEAGLRAQEDALIRQEFAAADNVVRSEFAAADAATLASAMMYTDQEVAEEAALRSAEDLTFLKLDGSREMMSDLDMGGYKIKDLAAPTLASDAVNKAYVDSAVSAPTGNLLDSNMKLKNEYLPPLAITSTYVVQTVAARDALSIEQVQEGDVVKVVEDHLAADGVTWLTRTYIRAMDSSSQPIWVELVTGSDLYSIQNKVGHVQLTTMDLPEQGDYRYYTPAREQAAKDYVDAQLDQLEIQQQQYREVTISSQILTDGFYDLDVAMAGVPWVMRQGIMGRPGVDFLYTSTRITFVGEWAVGGLTEIELGEKVYLYFMKATQPYLQ